MAWIVGLAAAAGGAFVLGLALRDGGSTLTGTGPVIRRQALIDQIRVQLATRYYRIVPGQILRLPDVHGMLAALHDPYTVYLAPAAYRQLQRETHQRYTGIGLVVAPGPRGLMVTGDWRGPGRRAGIRPGDTIVSIDGIPAAGVPFADIVGSTFGRGGVQVKLRVLREGRLLSFRLLRSSIAEPALSARIVMRHGDRIGYVRLGRFASGTANLMRRATQRLIAEGATGLIIDLRGNPGGLVDQAIGVSSIFLDHGVVVSLSSVHRPLHRYDVVRRGTPVKLPLVVLVDRQSASAAEIVAAALGDRGRALVVGERTYGKALVQAVIPLLGGGALKLTTARFFTPAGIDISHVGVLPDELVVDNSKTPRDEALVAAESALLRR